VIRAITKTDAAYQRLRSDIESGELGPGTRLPMRILMERLEMSPSPIREALRLLQRDALVEHTPHHGMIVSLIQPETVGDNYRIRTVLEPLATELATEKASAATIAEIRAIHDALRRAAETDPLGSDVADLNANWHASIYAASESKYLIEFIGRLWTTVAKAMWVSLRAEQSIAEHEAILMRIEHGDPSGAAALMRSHIQSGAEAYNARHKPQADA
jgi:DNA-binding GntR family transcriptional regulator